MNIVTAGVDTGLLVTEVIKNNQIFTNEFMADDRKPLLLYGTGMLSNSLKVKRTDVTTSKAIDYSYRQLQTVVGDVVMLVSVKPLCSKH